jgi:hypothetical protein
MHHQEESLLERIAYLIRFVENEPKVILEMLGNSQRMKNASADFNSRGAKPAGSIGIRQEVLRQQGMQVEVSAFMCRDSRFPDRIRLFCRENSLLVCDSAFSRHKDQLFVAIMRTAGRPSEADAPVTD